MARKKKFKFDHYNAVGIAEGFVETSGEEETIAAWQYLIDTTLQVMFGRQAVRMIEAGICHSAKGK